MCIHGTLWNQKLLVATKQFKQNQSSSTQDTYLTNDDKSENGKTTY